MRCWVGPFVSAAAVPNPKFPTSPAILPSVPALAEHFLTEPSLSRIVPLTIPISDDDDDDDDSLSPNQLGAS